jgi:hypothetical protein
VRNVYKILVGKPKERDDLEDLGIHGRILNRRYGEREWPELI